MNYELQKIENRVCLLASRVLVFSKRMNFMFYFSALKILLQTEEDKLTVALNNGLMSLADVSSCCVFSSHLILPNTSALLRVYFSFLLLH